MMKAIEIFAVAPCYHDDIALYDERDLMNARLEGLRVLNHLHPEACIFIGPIVPLPLERLMEL